ncbi:hypothetical protein HPULCUR_004795 [Helicostylum pulchrum]|uniref:Uncharacterized protein n=1 Tax=Helicostylum pulchrum TaxID=562976 RepID=A0ABP9XX76_9FUNG
MKVLYILCLLFAVTQAASLNKPEGGVGISVVSSNEFCMYLPPGPGLSVSLTENDAVAFCQTPTSYAKVFPVGFIQSAHYVRTSSYAQVTGRMKSSLYDIQVEDGGGQYDHKNLPKGTCNGMKYWVNVLEPDNDIYCIRCCQSKGDCNIGISTYGCEHIIPGNYN